jgi:hypothetical protein
MPTTKQRRFHIRGDNIVECERTLRLMQDVTEIGTDTITGPTCSACCPTYQLQDKHGTIYEVTFLPATAGGKLTFSIWCERVVASLRKRGQRLDAPVEDDRFAEKEPLLAQLYAASISGTLVSP